MSMSLGMKVLDCTIYRESKRLWTQAKNDTWDLCAENYSLLEIQKGKKNQNQFCS